ncbi:MAG: hypothetical protein M5U34_19045 [Chloroflexi bacterium]|nr:hypothetical protein [Chloroflexota bacterium]
MLPMLFISGDLFWRNVKLIRDPSRDNALGLFLSSNFYLLVLLLAIMISAMLPAPF